MKKELILIILIALASCTPGENNFELNQKWVLLTSEVNGIEIKDEIIHDPLLSFTIRDKKFYPAIRFYSSDSSVLVPGPRNTKELLYYSTNKALNNITFSSNKESVDTSLIGKLFLNNFKVIKDQKSGELILRTDSIKIRMMPSERFARRIKASQLD